MMIKLTFVHGMLDDQWTQEVWINPSYIIGMYALEKDPDDTDHPANTRLWFDPAHCIKGFGVNACPQVAQSAEEIMSLIACRIP